MAADISTYVKQIESASRGEEVRDALVNALNAIKDYTDGNYDTTYSFVYENGTLTITPSKGGEAQSIKIGGGTDYTFSLEDGVFKITPKDGDPQIFDLNKTINPGYTLEQDGTKIKLMRDSAEISSVDISKMDEDVLSSYY